MSRTKQNKITNKGGLAVGEVLCRCQIIETCSCRKMRGTIVCIHNYEGRQYILKR